MPQADCTVLSLSIKKQNKSQPKTPLYLAFVFFTLGSQKADLVESLVKGFPLETGSAAAEAGVARAGYGARTGGPHLPWALSMAAPWCQPRPWACRLPCFPPKELEEEMASSQKGASSLWPQL